VRGVHRVTIDGIAWRATFMRTVLVRLSTVPSHATPHPATLHEQENAERKHYPEPVLCQPFHRISP